jgi:predicted PhzF superfamily epimerase YddE/YHI9
MKLSFVTLDVFTDTRYTGNPLAIVSVPSSPQLSQSQKQNIAREFNLSETVFLHPAEPSSDKPAEVKIDIFTSIAEVPFAGHPTIGTASYLLRYQNAPVQSLLTKAGAIPIRALENKAVARVPHDVHLHEATVDSGLTSQKSPIFSIVKGMTFILLELPSLDALSTITSTIYKDTYAPKILDAGGWNVGILVTYAYVLGDFRDGVQEIRTRSQGSREDPATGSAASALSSYLALQSSRPGNFRFRIVQGVEMGRRSVIELEVVKADDGTIDSVFLSGEAVITMEGTLEIDL